MHPPLLAFLRAVPRKPNPPRPTAAVEYPSPYGTVVVGPVAPWGPSGWGRRDVYRPVDGGEPSEELVFCTGREDESPWHDRTFRGGYDSRCSPCFLQFTHTADYHREQVARAEVEEALHAGGAGGRVAVALGRADAAYARSVNKAKYPFHWRSEGAGGGVRYGAYAEGYGARAVDVWGAPGADRAEAVALAAEALADALERLPPLSWRR